MTRPNLFYLFIFRCSVLTCMPFDSRYIDILLAKLTERCCPAVQPKAITRLSLPSFIYRGIRQSISSFNFVNTASASGLFIT